MPCVIFTAFSAGADGQCSPCHSDTRGLLTPGQWDMPSG